MKILAFCRKNGWVMQNQWLGIHINKIWAYSTTPNPLKYLTTYSAALPNWPEYLEYLKKNPSHWVSVVRGPDDQLPDGYDGNDAFRWPLHNGIEFFLKSNLTFHSLECDSKKLFLQVSSERMEAKLSLRIHMLLRK